MTVKTKKILIRIISISLAILMVASVFASSIVGFAAEITESVDMTEPINYNEDAYSWERDPLKDAWVPVKKDDFEGVVFQLLGHSSSFSQLQVHAFIANVATKEVIPVTFTSLTNYVAAVPLQKGYYFLMSGDYAWSDGSGVTKCINNNEPIFFSYGVSNPEFWGYSYTDATDTQFVYFGQDISSCKKTIGPTSSLIISQEDCVYPLDMLIEEVFTYNDGDLEKTFTEIAYSEVAPEGADKEAFIASMKDLNPNPNSSNPNQSTSGEVVEKDPTLPPGINDSEYEDDYDYNKDKEYEGLEKVESENVGIPKTEEQPQQVSPQPVVEKNFIQMIFIDHISLWVILIGTAVCYYIVKFKRERNIDKQLEKDKFNDSHID